MEEMAEEISSQGVKAMEALQEYSEKKRDKLLFPDSSAGVLLYVKLKKSPFDIESGRKRKFVELPYPERSPENSSICLILPDTDRSWKAAHDPDVDRQAREWAEHLRTEFDIVEGRDYAKIFTMQQIEREYSMKKDRHQLANAYDIFLVDYKLMTKVNNFSQLFHKPAKQPLPIYSNVNFKKRLEKAYSITQVVFAPLKETVIVRIGNLTQSPSALEANLRAVVPVLLKYVPGGPVNIRSCHIQSMETSLPIFVDFGSANEVHLEGPRPKDYPEVMDELSTLPDGLAVQVRADGKVTVVKAETKEEVVYPTEQDEWEARDDLKPLSKEMVSKIVQQTANRQKSKESKTGKNLKKEVVNMKKKKKKAKKEEKEEEIGQNEEVELVQEEAPKPEPPQRKKRSRQPEDEELDEVEGGEKKQKKMKLAKGRS